jgi:hypothetical protein
MTLFVGESAPASGDFFYYGTSAMTRYMRRAIEDALGPANDFLASFKGLGWYLDDLVLTPVDKLARSERIAIRVLNPAGSTLLGSSVQGIFSAQVKDIPKLAEAIAKARAA